MNKDIECVLKRAGWTFCESMLAFYTAGQSLEEIDWRVALSVSCAAFIFSVIKSCVAGMPEVNDDEE